MTQELTDVEWGRHPRCTTFGDNNHGRVCLDSDRSTLNRNRTGTLALGRNRSSPGSLGRDPIASHTRPHRGSSFDRFRYNTYIFVR